MGLSNRKEIEEWIAARPNGEEALWAKLKNDSIQGEARRECLAYLRDAEVARVGRDAVEERELREREVAAVEKAAEASRDSARHAKTSARWAMLAVVVAAAALFVAAWPYIKDIGR
jgi:hypothetical protein